MASEHGYEINKRDGTFKWRVGFIHVLCLSTVTFAWCKCPPKITNMCPCPYCSIGKPPSCNTAGTRVHGPSRAYGRLPTVDHLHYTL